MLPVGTLVAFGESKIDDINSVFRLIVSATQKVVRFDVTMDNSLLMHHFNSLNHLHCDVKHSLQIEFPPAFLELILQTLS